MKSLKGCFILIIFVLFVFPGCKKNTNLSYDQLQKDAVLPDWAVEQEAEVPEKIDHYYKPGMVNADNMKRTVKKYLFFAKNYSDSNRYPYWLFIIGKFFLELDEEHAAYTFFKKVIELPDSTPCIDEFRNYPTLAEYKHDAKLLILKILAKNDLKTNCEEYMADINPLNSNTYFVMAQTYMLLGEKDKALEMLDKVLVDENLGNKYRKSSYTAGAVALAYFMGENEYINKFSEWIINEGKDSEKWLKKGKYEEFYKNLWTSSYEVIEKYRDLAVMEQKPELTELKDGVFTGNCRGFIDNIKVSVENKNGKIESIKVIDCKDDRPFSAVNTIPERVIAYDSLQVDTVTGATVSSTAILAALSEALIKAKKQ